MDRSALRLTPDAPGGALRLDTVAKRYGNGPFVLDGLTHVFAPGTATALVGPNGAGKSTLLRLLAALAVPTEGHVRYEAPEGVLDVHRAPYRYLRHVGIAHDEAELPAFLTAEELLAWIARERGTWDAEAPARHAALLDAVRLDERRRAALGTYSSGMRRKAQVAAALVGRPSVLLLDEPLRGLDAEATEAVLALLIAFRGAGGLVVVSSHRRDLLDRLCDDTLALGPGARAGPA